MSQGMREPAMTAPDARCTAVVLAGGTGTRVGAAVPKQLLLVAGKPVVEHCIAVFEAAPEIDDVLVVMAAESVPALREIVRQGGYSKVSAVVEGGGTRAESTYRALQAIDRSGPDAASAVLLHDAARPFLDLDTVSRCVAALRSHDAVTVAVPSPDTILVVDGAHDTVNGEGDAVVTSIPPRATLRCAQTPQGFRLPVLRVAYERAMADPEFARGAGVATDDCGVVLHYSPGTAIHVVPGSVYNMKITHTVDIAVAEAVAATLGSSGVGEREARR